MENKSTLDRIEFVAFAAAVLLSLPLVAGFFGRLHPALDSFAHFRLHFAAALVLVAIPLVLSRRFRWNGLLSAALGAWAIVNVTGLPGFSSGPAPVQASTKMPAGPAPIYRLMHLNLRFDNAEPGKVLSLIGRIRPDVVTLAEVSPMWSERLSHLESAYPYRVLCEVNGHAGGVAVLSLRPFAAGAEGRCHSDGAFAKVSVDFGGRAIDVGSLHLRWPWPMDQAGQIDGMAPVLRELSETSILAGDLNATPWSAASARIAEAAGMENAGPDGPTWLWRRLPRRLAFAGLPIDRVFVKGDVVVHSIATGEWVGSDHLPVLMEFSFRQSGPEPEGGQTATASL